MSAKTLSLWDKLTKNPSKTDLREDVMAVTDAKGKKNKAERVAGKEKRRERQAKVQAKRDATHKEKAEEGKSARLCLLSTVEVKKAADGFHISVNASEGTKTFVIAPDHSAQMLRDLETAIIVIRGQL